MRFFSSLFGYRHICTLFERPLCYDVEAEIALTGTAAPCEQPIGGPTSHLLLFILLSVIIEFLISRL